MENPSLLSECRKAAGAACRRTASTFFSATIVHRVEIQGQELPGLLLLLGSSSRQFALGALDSGSGFMFLGIRV